MSDCVPFHLYIGDRLPDLVPILLAEMKQRGVQVTGTDQSGTFSIALPIGGSVSGSFEVSGKSLAIHITSRPLVVSCGTIESKLQNFILDAKVALKNQDR
ncbi:MAG: hypothetical protein KDA85_05055 [Planctomycetaceae bacterium]|nr:hypothetical protein [Planctomycetaceae bacterium]